MGEVYQAEQRHTRQQCAIKVLRAAGAHQGRQHALRLFRREVRAIRMLKDEGIVPLLVWFSDFDSCLGT